MAHQTRAVVDLPRDITPLMPVLNDRIETCVHNKLSNMLAFNTRGHGVIVEAEQLSVLNPRDEKTAREIADWFLGEIRSAEKA